ncbi:hypothetical protein VFPPC_16172 [Pochonia chlamydosporia 170]|uniref:Uncharacterized protein n=1 Tax=Pochonia chlamydosporia 170 TaxID=1380566 RepID=A0A179FFW1_METCM|nr:hypothetical protein VFPPC_16172 [Pochonia chlamydosporia 170]OAQ64180.1 hypothetical protein VFPPC_16172 [Pochonia chlamydosporia 170]
MRRRWAYFTQTFLPKILRVHRHSRPRLHQHQTYVQVPNVGCESALQPCKCASAPTKRGRPNTAHAALKTWILDCSVRAAIEVKLSPSMFVRYT